MILQGNAVVQDVHVNQIFSYSFFLLGGRLDGEVNNTLRFWVYGFKIQLMT